MQKILTLIVLLTTLTVSALAQKKLSGSIKGKLVDTLYKENLSEATVTVLNPVDSSVISFTISNAKGEFEVKDLDSGSYRLMITFQGYQPYSQRFSISSQLIAINLGNVNMERRNTTLAEVVVEAPPIVVKKDTVEFKADAFKTKPNASAEDLLKKVPGMQVDKDGNVKAQGEDVQKVYVDGKEFFGSDPKLATKNITADMIESIQVFDDMSDQARFTRIDDGSRARTINIKLKKNMRKGYFGRLIAGGGSDDRYETSLMFNRFNGDRRISIVAGSNNLNKQTFSFNDIVGNMGGFGSRGGGGFQGGGGGNFGGGGFQGGGGNFGGGGRGGFQGGGGNFGGLGGRGGGGGITKTSTVGLNYTDKWGTKVDVTGSYFFSTSDNNSLQENLRQSFLTSTSGLDSIAVMDETSTSFNRNQNHRFNLRMEYYIDSMNSILFTPSVTFQHSESNSYDTSFTNSTIGEGNPFLSAIGSSLNVNERDGFNLNSNLLYRRKFGKIGRTLTIGWQNSTSKSDGNGSNLSTVTFFEEDGSQSDPDYQNLRTSQQTRSQNNNISASYTEPIGLNKLLEFNYAYTNRHSTSEKEALNFNTVSGKYDQINASQTNKFENDFIAHRGGANFRVQATKYNFQLGGAVEVSELTSHSQSLQPLRDTTVSQKFVNFFPTANFQYQFSRTKNLRIFYRGRTNQPSVSQLQDVVDSSNLQYVVMGNPFLKQEFSNNININFSSFNPANFRFISANMNFNNTMNKIVNSVSLERGKQTIVPVNLNGAFTANSFVTLGLPLRKMKGSSFNFTNSLSYIRDVGLVNKVTNTTNTFIASQTVGVNLDIKQKLNIGVNGSVALNDVNLVNDNAGASQQDQRYYTQTYSADITYTFLKSLVLSTDFDYILNSGLGEGYNQAIPLWNSSIALQVFKKKNGEIKFSVNDLLNQNQSIRRTVSNFYVQDTRSMVLKRYFLLTFTYNLNRAGQQQQQGGDRQGMPGGIPRNIQRQFQRNN
jgi:hypothetical protein